MATLHAKACSPSAAGWASSCRPVVCRIAVPAIVASLSAAAAGQMVVESPVDFQVVQRREERGAAVPIRVRMPGGWPEGVRLEARLSETRPAAAAARSDGGQNWQEVAVTRTGDALAGLLPLTAGGWRRLELRAVAAAARGPDDQSAGEVLGETAVERVGAGEIFVVAGQSNSANHGEARQRPTSGRVVTFDGTAWRPADDPQPGASGGGGSFMPALGDRLVAALDVPIGFVACGIGSTSVREWLPAGVAFPAPPTRERRVRRLDDGRWESDGTAYENLVARMRALGPRGFRAVLWHQGESDANQPDPTRSLPGPLYREFLGTVITRSRRDIGWEPPWMVALVSYHVPGDERSDEIRGAQAAVAEEGLALAGPDSDALVGGLRERGGKGVHFSEAGLHALAEAWADRLVPWIGTAPAGR